jgi:hypothetical protein
MPTSRSIEENTHYTSNTKDRRTLRQSAAGTKNNHTAKQCLKIAQEAPGIIE